MLDLIVVFQELAYLYHKAITVMMKSFFIFLIVAWSTQIFFFLQWDF